MEGGVANVVGKRRANSRYLLGDTCGEGADTVQPLCTGKLGGQLGRDNFGAILAQIGAKMCGENRIRE